MKTVIIGGGIAGLVSAFTLVKNGKEVILLEKEKIVGGRTQYCGAVTTEKFQPRLNALIKELNMEELKVPIKSNEQAFYTREGKLIEAEAFIKFIFSELGIGGTLSFMKVGGFVNKLEFDPENPDPKLDKYRKISFKEYLENECPGRISNFIKDLSSLFIFENDLSKVSAEYGLCHLRWGNEISTGKSFGFEENHLAMINNIIEEKIRGKGGEILTSCTVSSISKEGEKFNVSYETKERHENIEAHRLIMATPLYVSEKLFPEMNIESGVKYAKSNCLFVEGELKWPERKFIIGIPNNPANLRALFNVSSYIQVIHPENENKSVDLDKFYNRYKILEEKEISPAFAIMGPGCRIPEIKSSVNNAYLCGDFYYYPTLEAAVFSGEKAAKYVIESSS